MAVSVEQRTPRFTLPRIQLAIRGIGLFFGLFVSLRRSFHVINPARRFAFLLVIAPIAFSLLRRSLVLLGPLIILEGVEVLLAVTWFATVPTDDRGFVSFHLARGRGPAWGRGAASLRTFTRGSLRGIVGWGSALLPSPSTLVVVFALLRFR